MRKKSRKPSEGPNMDHGTWKSPLGYLKMIFQNPNTSRVFQDQPLLCFQGIFKSHVSMIFFGMLKQLCPRGFPANHEAIFVQSWSSRAHSVFLIYHWKFTFWTQKWRVGRRVIFVGSSRSFSGFFVIQVTELNSSSTLELIHHPVSNLQSMRSLQTDPKKSCSNNSTESLAGIGRQKELHHFRNWCTVLSSGIPSLMKHSPSHENGKKSEAPAKQNKQKWRCQPNSENYSQIGFLFG